MKQFGTLSSQNDSIMLFPLSSVLVDVDISDPENYDLVWSWSGWSKYYLARNIAYKLVSLNLNQFRPWIFGYQS